MARTLLVRVPPVYKRPLGFTAVVRHILVTQLVDIR